MQSINTYITEKLHLKKGMKSFTRGLDFLSKCWHSIPAFDEAYEDIVKYFNFWIEHYKINDNDLSYDCTEDTLTYLDKSMQAEFDNVVPKDEEDDYFSNCNLDGSEPYYIHIPFKTSHGKVFVYGHEDTLAVTVEEGGAFGNKSPGEGGACIFIHNK